MTELVSIYCIAFFAIECFRNLRRCQRMLTRTYVGDLDDKLAQASWMMICVGLVLTFSSNLIFLPCILFVKMAAAMFVEYWNHRNDIQPPARRVEIVPNPYNQVGYRKPKELAHNPVKLLTGGTYGDNSVRH